MVAVFHSRVADIGVLSFPLAIDDDGGAAVEDVQGGGEGEVGVQYDADGVPAGP